MLPIVLLLIGGASSLSSLQHTPTSRIRRTTRGSTPELDFHPLLAAPTNGSGVRIRLFPKGLQALNAVAANLLASQLPRILIPNIEHRLPGDQGVLHISRVRVSRFKRAALHNITMRGPNRILWQIEDVNIGMIGDLSGQTNIVVPLDLTGQAEILAESLTLHLEALVERSPHGSAQVKTSSCASSIDAVQVINHNGGLFGLAVSVFKQGISDNVRGLLERVICQEVKRYIDEDLNAKLAEVQTMSPLSQAVRLNAIRSKDLLNGTKGNKHGFSIDSFFGKDFGSDFFIDYRLKEPPRCGDNTIDFGSAGEISYQGSGGTPFGPALLPLPDIQKDEMLAVVVSDFVLNSLLFHAYRTHRLRVFLDSSTKGASGLLRTDCATSFCLGDLIPQLADSYPNSTLAMLFSVDRAPAVIFAERNGGLVTMLMSGVLILYVEESPLQKRQIAVFNVEVLATLALKTEKGKLHGSISLDKFDLVKRVGELKITREELSDIAILGSQFIEGMLNELFSTGFPLPVPQVVKLANLKLRILNRRMMILTDFSVDERRLTRIASAALFPFIPKAPDAPSISSLLDIEPYTQKVDAVARVVHLPTVVQPRLPPPRAISPHQQPPFTAPVATRLAFPSTVRDGVVRRSRRRRRLLFFY